MNIQSEIEFFSELGLIDKSRFLLQMALELGDEARVGGTGGSELSRLKFASELAQRLVRFAYQILSEDSSRPDDDVIIRMLLGARADKESERIVMAAYRRVLNGFESFDTTVLMGGR